MKRYFVEVAYIGTDYSGFQIQENAITIQGEIEKALTILTGKKISLTGSSRTDRGVHAFQNFFHFDDHENWTAQELEKNVYHLNAILPPPISITSIQQVADDAHCRFDARFRKYQYRIYNTKNPFLNERAYYFPFPLELDLMQRASEIISNTKNFESFAKIHSQVHTHDCNIFGSSWLSGDVGGIVYEVKANRFLRGMVKALVGTMLQVGRNKISLQEFENIINSKDCSQADFSPPSHGLYLLEVGF